MTLKQLIHVAFVAKANRGIVQLFRYGFVGGISAIVDIGTLYLATTDFHIHYLISAAIAFVVATIVNYILSVLWIFESSGKIKTELALFTLVGIGGLILNEFFIWFFVEKTGLYYLTAKLISVSLVMMWSFTLRRLVFTRLLKRPAQESQETEAAL